LPLFQFSYQLRCCICFSCFDFDDLAHFSESININAVVSLRLIFLLHISDDFNVYSDPEQGRNHDSSWPCIRGVWPGTTGADFIARQSNCHSWQLSISMRRNGGSKIVFIYSIYISRWLIFHFYWQPRLNSQFSILNWIVIFM